MFAVIFLGAVVFIHAQEPGLKVLVTTFPPFVFEEEGRLKGFDIDLWEAIARNQNLGFEYMQQGTLPDILNSLAEGRADAGMAGITINRSREERLDFSHSYFSSGLGILVKSRMDESFFDVLKSVFSPGMRKIILGMMLFIVICAHLIWFFERGKDAIHDSYFPGIFEGAWWTVVTMSTVGYGDIAPKKWSGRVIGVFVIVTGIAFFGIVIAELSSTFALKNVRGRIEDVRDLRGKRVAVVQGTTSEYALKERGVHPVLADDFSRAREMLEDGKVKAVVFDTPVIKYFLSKQKGRRLKIAGQFDPQPYGIALQTESPWREKINRGLLAVQEAGEYAAICSKWFAVQP